jgi:hypothetical protein
MERPGRRRAASDPVTALAAPGRPARRAPVQQFYARWADRSPLWNIHGLWENRLAAISEADI